MEAYEIDKSRWAFKLAPYLSGKAQQAYTSLSAEEAAHSMMNVENNHRRTAREQFYPRGGEREEGDKTPAENPRRRVPRIPEETGSERKKRTRQRQVLYSCSKTGHLSCDCPRRKHFSATGVETAQQGGRQATFRICGGKRSSRHCTGHRVLKDDDTEKPGPDNKGTGRWGRHGAVCARRHGGIPSGSGGAHSGWSTPDGGSGPVGHFAYGGTARTRRA